MKSLQNRHYKALELDKILLKLSKLTNCEDAKDLALNLLPQINLSDAEELLKQTEDAYIMLAKYGGPSFGGLKNINNSLARAAAGSVLTMKELLEVARVLRAISSLYSWRLKNEGESFLIDEFFSALMPNKHLEGQISSSILAEDEMADSASQTLSDIRRNIRRRSSDVRTILEKIIHSSFYKKFLQDGLVTQRNGRFVIPVKSEHRSEISGLVHDTSSSGATVFIEPMAVVEANNDINILKGKEKQEIDRILSQLSAEVGSYQESISYSYKIAVDLNLIFAKARLAYDMKASMPLLNDEGIIDFKKARHPLLNPATVVPTDINLGLDFDTLVITGPNTGGKTVSIKTIGLLTLMAMCGLMIPTLDNSRVCVFKKVFADIGDEQSIEQSLSTFSSHMVNIVDILKKADNKSLVLIDELGAGTDPIEGAALAMAILEQLKLRGCKTAATTHYSELKAYALQAPRVENGSCEFDINSLKPTYRLLIGIPGRSNAFAISQRLGMEEDIISKAQNFISGESLRFEDVVDNLEQSRLELEKEREEVENLKAQIEDLKKQAEDRLLKAEKQGKKEQEKAVGEAKRIVENARRQSALLLDEIESLKKEKGKAQNVAEFASRARRQLKKGLDQIDEVTSPMFDTKIKDENYVLPRPLVIGDSVFVYDISKEASVIGLPNKNGQVEVQAGILKLRVDLKNLRLIEKKAKKKTVGAIQKQTESLETKQAKTSLDLRGMTIEEGILELDRFIDDSVLTGFSEITIIHGKGTGALRTAVGQHLRKHPQVKTYRLGTFGEGESGVSIAELK